jgi:15-cis-phytoene synthase
VSQPDALTREARAVTSKHAKTFSLAARLLPRDVRDDVRLLYLVLRSLDDAVDEHEPDAAERVAAVEAWATGEPGEQTREVLVLALLDERHDLPRASVQAFCAGMRDDLAGRAFDTDGELDEYCYRVAGTVGELMASVLGIRGDRDEALLAARTLGSAMQRTNVLRDIDEDLAAGRIYLPAAAVARHGGSLAPGARQALVREQSAIAEREYRAGMAGIARLRRGRLAIRAAAAMYREILREIERRGPQPGRAVVPTRRKLRAAVRG